MYVLSLLSEGCFNVRSKGWDLRVSSDGTLVESSYLKCLKQGMES